MKKVKKIADPKYSREEIESCIHLLEGLLENQEQLAYLTKELKIALMSAAGRISRPDKIDINKRRRNRLALIRQTIENHDRSARAKTEIRSARVPGVYTVPEQITNSWEEKKFKNPKFIKPQDCYVCKNKFTQLHFFYDLMCPKCAEFNYSKRFQTASLEGQVAIITGSRVKIGYQAALKMLRAGAHVIATTRFL